MSTESSRRITTSLPQGITNLADDDLLADMALPDPSRYFQQFEDFDKISSLDNIIFTQSPGIGGGAQIPDISTTSYTPGGQLSVFTGVDIGDTASAILTPKNVSVLPFVTSGGNSKMGGRIRWQCGTTVDSVIAIGWAQDIPNGDPDQITDGYFIYKGDQTEQITFRIMSFGVMIYESAFMNTEDSLSNVNYETTFVNENNVFTMATQRSTRQRPTQYWQDTTEIKFPAFPLLGPIAPFVAMKGTAAGTMTIFVDYMLSVGERWYR